MLNNYVAMETDRMIQHDNVKRSIFNSILPCISPII